MTKVKKTKKPKAKKVGKKSVSKKIVSKEGSARVEKIDPRLRPTPPPKLLKVDPMLYNPLKISDNQRSRLISETPFRMFSGQETANLNRQLDVITSKEQQLEEKILELKKSNLNNEINSNLRDLNDKINILDDNYSKPKYKELKKKLMEINRLIPKSESALIDFYENLNNRLDDIKENVEMDSMANIIFDDFKEVKSTNTLLDDKISKNNLVDEAEIIVDKIKSKRKSPLFESESDDLSLDSLDELMFN